MPLKSSLVLGKTSVYQAEVEVYITINAGVINTPIKFPIVV